MEKSSLKRYAANDADLLALSPSERKQYLSMTYPAQNNNPQSASFYNNTHPHTGTYQSQRRAASAQPPSASQRRV